MKFNHFVTNSGFLDME